MKELVAKNRKAIAAALAPVVTYVAARAGLNLSPEESLGAATAVTTLAVYFLPNSYGTGLSKPE